MTVGRPLFECGCPLKEILRVNSSGTCLQEFKRECTVVSLLKRLLRVNSSGTCLQEFIGDRTVLSPIYLVIRNYLDGTFLQEFKGISTVVNFNCTNTFKLL